MVAYLFECIDFAAIFMCIACAAVAIIVLYDKT